jgi:hypothetical protein
MSVPKKIAAIARTTCQMGLILFGQRRAKGMQKTDVSLHRTGEWMGAFAFVGVCMVLLGLGVELSVAIHNRHGKTFPEAWGPVFGTALIALGIVLEFTSHLASKEIEGELTRRSEERVAAANKLAAEAHERAALAEERAETLKKNLAWRSIPKEVRSMLALVLSKHRGAAVGIGYTNGDPESMMLARNFAVIFVTAKWEIRLQSFVTTKGVIFGLRLEKGRPDAETIAAAFKAADIKFDWGQIPEPPEDWPETLLFVGVKAPWQLMELPEW